MRRPADAHRDHRLQPEQPADDDRPVGPRARPRDHQPIAARLHPPAPRALVAVAGDPVHDVVGIAAELTRLDVPAGGGSGPGVGLCHASSGAQTGRPRNAGGSTCAHHRTPVRRSGDAAHATASRPAALRDLPAADAQDRHQPDAWRCIATWSWSSTSTGSATTRPGSASTTPAGCELIASPEVFIAAAARADEADQARHRRQLAAVPPPVHPRRPHRHARPPHPGPDDVRRRPGPADERRGDARHRPDDAAAADGAGVRRDDAAVPRRDRHREDRLVHVRRGRAADPSRTATSTSPWPASISPSGSKLAGRYGTGLLSIAATEPAAFGVLDYNYKVWQDEAARNGHEAPREKWRLMGPMHIAETLEQAEGELPLRPAVGVRLPQPHHPDRRPERSAAADRLRRVRRLRQRARAGW